jgi:hypothetical protein
MHLRHDTLDGIREVVEALERAEEDLRLCTPEALEQFQWEMSFAFGKLGDISESLKAPPKTEEGRA